jgi:hypothetical protein
MGKIWKVVLFCLKSELKQATKVLENTINFHVPGKGGTRGGTTLQTGRSRFRFSMMSWEFFSDIILPVALWPWGRLSL